MHITEGGTRPLLPWVLLPLDQGTRGHWTGRQPDSTKLGQSTTAAASRQDALKFSGKWAICKTTVDRIIFQSTARLPQSVRAAAKRFGGELTDSDQLSQLREAVDQRQNSKAKSCHSCLAPTQSVTVRNIHWQQATVVGIPRPNRHSLWRYFSTTIETIVNPMSFYIVPCSLFGREIKSKIILFTCIQLMIDWVGMWQLTRSGGTVTCWQTDTWGPACYA